MILSDGFWHSRFQADPDVIGKVIRVNARDCTIVGVMAPDPALSPMELIAILNRCYRFRGFIYYDTRFSAV